MEKVSEKTLFKQFSEFGRDLFVRGLISSHAGNISVRTGDRIYITRRGAMLGRLGTADIVRIDLEKDDPSKLLVASSEVPVHRAIYRSTDACAVVHAHPPYATLLSMTEHALIPVDWEGSYFFRKIPVLTPGKAGGKKDVAGSIGRRMKNHTAILVEGHGSFTRGNTLEEAYMLTSSLEASAFFIYRLKR
ncbi:MAG: Methylthioribulose-1-phosphate dehydratase [Syntrophorhabdus sp. PtaU1.Bin058]|nr:MAG: Methylthioribulose-1-phosphate dehydratase [Syntrophorhabdus sp. PtaU1.Bin058]